VQADGGLAAPQWGPAGDVDALLFDVDAGELRCTSWVLRATTAVLDARLEVAGGYGAGGATLDDGGNVSLAGDLSVGGGVLSGDFPNGVASGGVVYSSAWDLSQAPPEGTAASSLYYDMANEFGGFFIGDLREYLSAGTGRAPLVIFASSVHMGLDEDATDMSVNGDLSIAGDLLVEGGDIGISGRPDALHIAGTAVTMSTILDVQNTIKARPNILVNNLGSTYGGYIHLLTEDDQNEHVAYWRVGCKVNSEDFEIRPNATGQTFEIDGSTRVVRLGGDLEVNGGDIGIAGHTNLLSLASGELAVDGNVELRDSLRLTTHASRHIGRVVFENPSAGTEGGNATLYLSPKRADESNGNQLLRLFGVLSGGTSGTSALEILAPGTYTVVFSVDAATGNVHAAGDVTLGDAAGDVVTCNGAFKPRQASYATGMNDDVAGTEGELVYCTTDNTFYGCTVSGDPATWAALH